MPRLLTVRFSAVVAMLSATLLVLRTVELRRPGSLHSPLYSIDKELGSWRMTNEQTLSAPVLQRLMPTEYISRLYQKNNWRIGVFVTYFSHQRAGETMHSPQVCVPGSGWQIWKRDTAVVPRAGSFHEVNQYHVRNASQRMVMLYWYQSHNQITRSEYIAKLMLIKGRFLDGRSDGSLVRLILPENPGASDQAIELASLIINSLQRCFGNIP